MSTNPDQIIDRRRLKRRITAWRTLAIVAAVAALALVVQNQIGDQIGGDHVAWLNVRGIIIESRDREESLRRVAEDDRAKALIVYIDSPGGTTYGGEELFHGLREIASEKPVVAVIGTLGTSAGYLVALASERIFARATSLTGSIGVLMETAEISKLLESIGVSTDAIKSGAFKGTPSPFEPMSEVSRTVVQSVVDDSYRWFVGILAERRGLSSDEARELSDGRVYTGRQALEAGLIDELGSTADARQWLEHEHNISSGLPLRDSFDPDTHEHWVGRLLGLAKKMVFSERLTLDGLISLWHPDS